MIKTESNFYTKFNSIFSSLVLGFCPILLMILIFCYFNYDGKNNFLYPLLEFRIILGDAIYCLLLCLVLFIIIVFSIMIYMIYYKKRLLKDEWCFNGIKLSSPSLKKEIVYSDIKKVMMGLKHNNNCIINFIAWRTVKEYNNTLILILDNYLIALNLIHNKNGKKFLEELKKWLSDKMDKETEIDIKDILLKGFIVKWNLLLPIYSRLK